MTDLEQFMQAHLVALNTITTYLKMILELQGSFSETMIQFINFQTRQATQLQQWKEANPGVVASCQGGAAFMGRKQSEMIKEMADELSENIQSLEESPFLLSEFLEKNGPKIYNMNLISTTLSHLS